MRVDLDAEVLTSDGVKAGRVLRAVVDPSTNEVTDFVITTGGLFGRDVIVPRRELESASADGDSLRLDLTKEQLSEMPDYVPASYVSPPVGWVPPPAYGYPPAGYLWPAGVAYPAVPPTSTSEGGEQAAGPESTSVEKGAVVLDRDGDDVGVIEEVVFDSDGGDLRAIVIRVGGFLLTLLGGGETVRVDARLVDRVESGIVRLGVDKEDVVRAA